MIGDDHDFQKKTIDLVTALLRVLGNLSRLESPPRVERRLTLPDATEKTRLLSLEHASTRIQ
jgi:hypothetical protein